MRSANSMVEITERAPEVRTARRRLIAAGLGGDPYAAESAAREVMLAYNRVMLRLLVQRCAVALRGWVDGPDVPARRWRGGGL